MSATSFTVLLFKWKNDFLKHWRKYSWNKWISELLLFFDPTLNDTKNTCISNATIQCTFSMKRYDVLRESFKVFELLSIENPVKLLFSPIIGCFWPYRFFLVLVSLLLVKWPVFTLFTLQIWHLNQHVPDQSGHILSSFNQFL